MKLKWYFVSIIALVSFPILAFVILKVWSLLDSNFAIKSAGLGLLGYTSFAALISFIISSTETIYLSKDKKILSLIFAWLLMAGFILIVTQFSPPDF